MSGYIYKGSIQEYRRSSKERMEANKRTFFNLANKTSQYAKEVEALGELHKQVHEIYKNAKDEV